MPKLAYTLSEFARLTGRGRTTLYEAIAAGDLPAKKSGRSTIILADDWQGLLGEPSRRAGVGRDPSRCEVRHPQKRRLTFNPQPPRSGAQKKAPTRGLRAGLYGYSIMRSFSNTRHCARQHLPDPALSGASRDANARALSRRQIARVLGGEVAGGQVLFPGPGHSRQDRSACLRLDPRAPGGFVVHSFAGDDPLPIRDHVRERLGLPSPASGSPQRRDEHDVDDGCPCQRQSTTPGAPGAPSPSGRRRTTRAERPLRSYLRRRGLELPDEAAGEALRFHPACPFAGKRTPAMVALVRDVVTNEPKAIHRTALTLDGHKVEVDGKDRLALGPIAGGAVKLTPDEDVTLALGIGEGIETTLSLRELPEFGASPVWALLSAGGVAAFPVLAGIECLWIAVDHDPAGERCRHACADRWRAAGREVYLVRPVPSAPTSTTP